MVHMTRSTPLHCDNPSAIQIAYNDVFHECTKHMKIDYHFMTHFMSTSISRHYASISISINELTDFLIKSCYSSVLASTTKISQSYSTPCARGGVKMHNTILVLRTAILFISCNIEGSRLMICKLRKITFIFYCNTII